MVIFPITMITMETGILIDQFPRPGTDDEGLQAFFLIIYLRLHNKTILVVALFSFFSSLVLPRVFPHFILSRFHSVHNQLYSDTTYTPGISINYRPNQRRSLFHSTERFVKIRCSFYCLHVRSDVTSYFKG